MCMVIEETESDCKETLNPEKKKNLKFRLWISLVAVIPLALFVTATIIVFINKKEFLLKDLYYFLLVVSIVGILALLCFIPYLSMRGKHKIPLVAVCYSIFCVFGVALLCFTSTNTTKDFNPAEKISLTAKGYSKEIVFGSHNSTFTFEVNNESEFDFSAIACTISVFDGEVFLDEKDFVLNNRDGFAAGSKIDTSVTIKRLDEKLYNFPYENMTIKYRITTVRSKNNNRLKFDCSLKNAK